MCDFRKSLSMNISIVHVWRVEPNDVPCSVLASAICWLIAHRTLERFTVAAGLEEITVDL